FAFTCYGPCRDLLSFPTRRSSDLELGEEEVEQRLGGQLGDPAAAVGYRFLSAGERAPVRRLGELDAGDRQQRAERTVDEMLAEVDRKSTRLNSSHRTISYAVFCLK